MSMHACLYYVYYVSKQASFSPGVCFCGTWENNNKRSMRLNGSKNVKNYVVMLDGFVGMLSTR